MSFWNAALSLTGVFAIGAFVFYRLYRKWTNDPSFETLEGQHRFQLFRLLVVLTFCLFVISAGVYLVHLFLEARSAGSLVRDLRPQVERRLEAGNRILERAEAADPEKEKQIQQFREDYNATGERQLQALDDGNLNEFYETTRQNTQLIHGARARQVLPESTQKEMHDQAKFMEGLVPGDPTEEQIKEKKRREKSET